MPTSTINPAVPASGASLSSAAIRANFQAAVNDINALWNATVTDPTFNSITGSAAPFTITGRAGTTGVPPGGSVVVAGGGAFNANAGNVSIVGGTATGLLSPGNGGDVNLTGGTPSGGGTTGKVVISGSAFRVGSTLTIANGSVATALSSVGPSGSHTTVQEWLVIQNSSGAARYIPCF